MPPEVFNCFIWPYTGRRSWFISDHETPAAGPGFGPGYYQETKTDPGRDKLNLFKGVLRRFEAANDKIYLNTVLRAYMRLYGAHTGIIKRPINAAETIPGKKARPESRKMIKKSEYSDKKINCRTKNITRYF